MSDCGTVPPPDVQARDGARLIAAMGLAIHRARPADCAMISNTSDALHRMPGSEGLIFDAAFSIGPLTEAVSYDPPEAGQRKRLSAYLPSR